MRQYTDILASGSVLDYGASLIGRLDLPLPTGLPSWDGACDEMGGRGLGDWWYVVLGGASNSGKTRMMLHLARSAVESGHRPGLITMEVPTRGLQRQVYSNLTRFSFFDFLPHHWERGDPVEKVKALASEVSEYRQGERTMVVAEHDAPPTLRDIEEACQELQDIGCTVVFVDHLQLIKAGAAEVADRATEISECLRWFAHGQRMLVVALSQLNRLASRERQRRPTMHDLLGGTSIESNANQVVLLDHSRQVRDVTSPHLLRTWLYLDKNREGPNRIEIPIEANFRTGQWREAMPDEVNRWTDE